MKKILSHILCICFVVCCNKSYPMDLFFEGSAGKKSSDSKNDDILTKFKNKQKNKLQKSINSTKKLDKLMEDLNNSSDELFEQRYKLAKNSFWGTELPEDISVYYFRMPSKSTNTNEDIEWAEKQFGEKLDDNTIIAVKDVNEKLIFGKIISHNYQTAVINIGTESAHEVNFFDVGRFSLSNKKKLLQHVDQLQTNKEALIKNINESN